MSATTPRALLLCVLLLSGLAGPALLAADPPARAGKGPGSGAESAELEDTVELYRVHRMRLFLGLSDDQTTRVMQVFDGMGEERKALKQQREPLLARLRQEVESATPDERVLRSTLDSLEAIRKKQDQAEERFRRDLMAILDTVQQAKFVFFQQRFERELQERMEMFRERRRERQDRPSGQGGAGR